LLTDSWY